MTAAQNEVLMIATGLRDDRCGHFSTCERTRPTNSLAFVGHLSQWQPPSSGDCPLWNWLPSLLLELAGWIWTRRSGFQVAVRAALLSCTFRLQTIVTQTEGSCGRKLQLLCGELTSTAELRPGSLEPVWSTSTR